MVVLLVRKFTVVWMYVKRRENMSNSFETPPGNVSAYVCNVENAKKPKLDFLNWRPKCELQDALFRSVPGPPRHGVTARRAKTI